ncbi:MAG: sensor histidine kinase [Lachnospiraceae bacterium]
MEGKQFGYSKLGKLLKGFFCLAAFGVFVVCFMIVVCGYASYGEDVITNPKSGYYETRSYQDDVLNRIYSATGHLLYIPDNMMKNNEFSVIDVEQKELYTYDLEDMYNFFAGELEYTDTLSYYNSFRKDYENINYLDLSDYQKARGFLEYEKYQNSYIYFNDTTFRALFLDQGIRNIEHRFSYDFDENAYFIFDYQGKTKTAEKTLEKIRDCDREESIGEKYDLTDIDYAVYDGTIYYSTGDDYFEPYNCYVYKVSDLCSLLKEIDPEGTRYDSILFGLLKSNNMNEGWIEEPYYAYDSIRSMKTALDNMFDLDTSGDFYFLYADGSLKCSEQDLVENIKNNPSIPDMERQVMTYLKDHNCTYYSFRFPGNGKINCTTNGVPFEYADRVANEFGSYGIENDVLFVYGFATENSSLDSYSMSQYAKNYSFFAKYIRFIIGAGIAALVVTILLAVSLICTTGRTYKKDKDVVLNTYDRLYSEVWWLITCGVICTLASAEYAIFNEQLRDFSVATMVLFTVESVVFAYFIMIFVLSLCRRIKGGLVFHKSLIIKFVKWLWQHGKKGVITMKNDTLAKVKGTNRFLFLYVIFAMINFLLIWFCYDFYTPEPILLSFILQLLGLFAVIFLVRDTNALIRGVEQIVKGDLDYKVKTDEKFGIYKELTNNINHIGDGLKAAVETSLKDERMKTELITNVSHDLKTPLTSIINYIELLKKEEMESEDAKHYIEVLDGKAQRLKQLTEDLVEAAKATSGNIELTMMTIDFNELMSQAIGEFEEKFATKELEVVASHPEEPVKIMADGRRLYRVLENVLQNVCKYAMPKTRVYIDLVKEQEKAVFTVKNVSDAPLNISPDELMERFTRGDASRTTEGSGLGLSIAKDLTALQKGKFSIVLDGDLFKVVITFPLVDTMESVMTEDSKNNEEEDLV